MCRQMCVDISNQCGRVNICLCRSTWEDPVAGSCTDTFELSDDGNQLTVHTRYRRFSNDRETRYKTVYTRAS